MDGPPPGPRPGSHDRAWNDPPLFSYSSGAGTSGKLNKRVGFPSSQLPPPSPTSGAVPPTLPLSVKPPPSSDLAPPPQAAVSGSLAASGAGGHVDQGDYEDPQPIVVRLGSVIDSISGDLGQRKADDLKKRISVMETKWGSLNPEMRRGIHAVSEHLTNQEFAKAEKIQKTLMVDWPSLCGTWMVGVKHVIQEAKKVQSAAGCEDPDQKPEGSEVRMIPLPAVNPQSDPGAF